MIVAFLDRDHREWDEHLRDFRFAYNTAHHTSIGTLAAFLNLDRELWPPKTMRAKGEVADEIESQGPEK